MIAFAYAFTGIITPVDRSRVSEDRTRRRVQERVFDGEMFAMAGGTPQHSLIATNLTAEFRDQLKAHHCVSYNADLRLKVEATGLCTYPALSVICGRAPICGGNGRHRRQPHRARRGAIRFHQTNDRGKKFEHYRQMTSLKEYLLVSQKEPRFEQFIRQGPAVQRAMKDMKAWISGIRRDQTPVRARAKVLELQEDGLLKINPLLNWTKEDIKNYLREHGLPVHPLFQCGYRSIGCSPCTVAIGLNDDERAGRWHGRGKIECGLHTSMFSHKDPAEIRLDFKLDISAGEK